VTKILNVWPQDDHTLLIELSNHHKIVYDLKPRLQAVRFCGLTDLKRFKNLWIENENTLIWDGMCQMTIDEIIDTLGK